MTKYAGMVGFSSQEEDPPNSGIWSTNISETRMYGDIIKKAHSFESGEKINDDITVQNRFSLVGSPHAFTNFMNMKYITWMGNKWKVANVEVQRPRLIVTVGGVYNG